MAPSAAATDNAGATTIVRLGRSSQAGGPAERGSLWAMKRGPHGLTVKKLLLDEAKRMQGATGRGKGSKGGGKGYGGGKGGYGGGKR